MDNFKDIEISGRKFRIKKFGARDGRFMALKVSGILAGIFNKPGKPGKAKKVDDGGNLWPLCLRSESYPKKISLGFRTNA
ncbi:hypothetical protein LJK88_20490 [Paenibacillus sp. P26]|nr:hypothetical protein LJK88_20490 [Paenibacillus sp. P26]